MSGTGQRGTKKALKDYPEPVWAQSFFDALKVTGSVATAAAAVKINGKPRPKSRNTVYFWRSRSTQFKRHMDDAWENLADELEGGALRRAINGWNEPVYYKGEKKGDRRVYSPGLTIFMLKCLRPQKYNVQHEAAKSASAMEHAKGIRETLAQIEAAMGGDPDLADKIESVDGDTRAGAPPVEQVEGEET